MGSALGIAQFDETDLTCSSDSIANARAITIRPIQKDEDIYLIDHMWTFADESHAKQELSSNKGLRIRLAAILGISNTASATDDTNDDDLISAILAQMWTIVGSYCIIDENAYPNKYYFVSDEVGCR